MKQENPLNLKTGKLYVTHRDFAVFKDCPGKVPSVDNGLALPGGQLRHGDTFLYLGIYQERDEYLKFYGEYVDRCFYKILFQEQTMWMAHEAVEGRLALGYIHELEPDSDVA